MYKMVIRSELQMSKRPAPTPALPSATHSSRW